MTVDNFNIRTGDHFTVSTIGNTKYTWDVFKLWDLVAGMSVEEVPIQDFDLDIDVWFREYEIPTILNVIKHCKKILDADLDFPIIIAPKGIVLDGMHRIAKAWILGYSTIKAIRLQEFPTPDFIEEC